MDKAVLVNRAALSEPSDVFVRSSAPMRQTGNKMAASSSVTSGATHRGRLSGSCPRMDSICEGSDEGSSSSSSETDTATTSGSFGSRDARGTLTSGFSALGGTTGRRLPLTGRTRSLSGPCRADPASYLQGSDAGQRVASLVEKCRSPCAEVGTNTSSVMHHDKATSTDSLCSVVVDGKMAECISKLRTVSQRLEQHQSLSPRNSSPPEANTATPPKEPLNAEPPTPPGILSSPASGTPPVATTDDTGQAADQEDEVKQFVSELKSAAPVAGKPFAIDRKRGGKILSRQEKAVESPTSSPRSRRSNLPGRAADRPFPRSYSPRARTRNEGAPAGVPGPQDSPTQRRWATSRKLPVVGSPPTAARHHSGRAGSTTAPAAGTPKSPGSSPRVVRPPRTAAGARRLAAVDDEQTRSTSDSESHLTHSGTSSDDQQPPRSSNLAKTSVPPHGLSRRSMQVSDQKTSRTKMPDQKPSNPSQATSVPDQELFRPPVLHQELPKSSISVPDQRAHRPQMSNAKPSRLLNAAADPELGVAPRPPSTPTLARRQRIDMTQMLLVKSASLPDQQSGETTSGVKQVRGSPTTARRMSNSIQN